MPEVRILTTEDVTQGALENMHPRIAPDGESAEVTLMPEDILEGKGNFLSVDGAGNPEGFRLGQPPKVVARNVYMGTDPQRVTKQNGAPIPVHETSFLLGGPLGTGEVPPDPLMAGALPQPLKPTIQPIPATTAGYPASTPDRPYWISYGYGRSGRHTALAPPVLVPPLAQGQSMRIRLPDQMPVGGQGIDIWLSHPGQSSISTTGQMRLQKYFDFAAYGGREVELKGPYVYSIERPEGTSLPAPAPPKAVFSRVRRVARAGTYYFAATAANDLGESLPSSTFGPISVQGSAEQPGEGLFSVTRPNLPQGATGWYLYVLYNGEWHRVYHPVSGSGLNKPLPYSWNVLEFGGWSDSEELGRNESFLLSPYELPQDDTSGIPGPDSPLETPVVFGATRVSAGRYYARTSDVAENGEESPLSEAAWVDIGQNDLPRVVFANPINALPNATLVEKGSDGYPLGYSVLNTPDVSVENGVLSMWTNGPQTGSTVEVHTDVVRVDPTKEWGVGALLEVGLPTSGALSGSFEAVLREINASAEHTDTILKSASILGEHAYHVTVHPPGYGSPSWQADTLDAQIIYRFSGSQKNMSAKVSRQVLKDFAYSFRRREKGRFGLAANPNPAPETTADPSGSVAVEPSPTPEASPETLTQASPDRPIYTADSALETLDFSTMPSSSSWAQDVSGATLNVSAGKLVATKTGGSARANLSKTFAPPLALSNRNSLGLSLEGVDFPTLPTDGSVTFAELKTPSGSRFAWLDVDTRKEQAQIVVNSPPISSGNVVTTLDEGGATTRNTAVVATKESATLSIDFAPSMSGDVGVTLDGKTTNVPAIIGQAGLQEVVEVEITRGAAGKGYVQVSLGSPYPNQRETSQTAAWAIAEAGDSPRVVADKLRAFANNPAWQHDHWTISGSGSKVVFTAKFAAHTYGGHSFSSAALVSPGRGLGQTYTAARITVTQEGREEITGDTATSLAEKIRTATFEGYQTVGSGTTVTFEALEPGAKGDASYDSHQTGAAGSMVTTVQGAQDSIEDVAQKIAATYSANSYWTAVRSGAVLTFLATSAGTKQDTTVFFGTTGASGRVQTLVQGSSDVVLHALDRYGTRRQRRLFTGVTTSTTMNVGLYASGTSRGVIQAWGSLGADPKTLRALFEGMDLPATGTAVIGPTSESSSSVSWSMRVNEAKVWDVGDTYYRYHTYLGEVANQLHGFFLPNQPTRDDLFLRDGRFAVLPGAQYTAGVFTRFDGFSAVTPKPLFLYAITREGDEVPLGDVIGGLPDVAFPQPLTSSAWDEFSFTFTVPEDCCEVRLESRKMGPGEIVCQELAISPGASVKRTPLYALDGTYVPTLDLRTPTMLNPSWWSRVRKFLRTDVETPSGSNADVSYHAADEEEGAYGSPISNPDDVPQKNFIRVVISASGNGLKTPVVRGGFPFAEYVLVVGSKPLATFLKEDRTEFAGGAIFAKLEEFAYPPEVIFRRLPGPRYTRTATYPPIGNAPGFELQVFTPEARRFIEDRCGMVNFCIEAWGQIWTIKLSGPVRFERQIADIYKGDQRYNHYKAKFPEAEVVSVRDLP